MTTREQVELILLALADYEARARRTERRLPGDSEVAALMADIGKHRDTAIAALELLVTDESGGVH